MQEGTYCKITDLPCRGETNQKMAAPTVYYVLARTLPLLRTRTQLTETSRESSRNHRLAEPFVSLERDSRVLAGVREGADSGATGCTFCPLPSSTRARRQWQPAMEVCALGDTNMYLSLLFFFLSPSRFLFVERMAWTMVWNFRSKAEIFFVGPVGSDTMINSDRIST